MTAPHFYIQLYGSQDHLETGQQASDSVTVFIYSIDFEANSLHPLTIIKQYL
jgi:hypothetical protein